MPDWERELAKRNARRKGFLRRSRNDARATPLHLGNDVWSSVQHGSNGETTVPQWDRKSLGAYQAYPRLYGERKYAEDVAQPFPFKKLPAEIKDMIYALLLDFGVIRIDTRHRNNEDARSQRYITREQRQSAREQRRALCLLRVDKETNREAADIFYGQNFFKIDNFGALSRFCWAIGMENTKRIASLTRELPIADHLYIYPPSCDHTEPRVMARGFRILRVPGRFRLRHQMSCRIPEDLFDVAKALCSEESALRRIVLTLGRSSEVLYDRNINVERYNMYGDIDDKLRYGTASQIIVPLKDLCTECEPDFYDARFREQLDDLCDHNHLVLEPYNDDKPSRASICEREDDQ